MARSCAAARPRTVPMGRHPGWGSWGPSSEVVCGSKLHTLAPAPLCFVFTGSLPAERRAPRLPPPPPFPRTSPRPQGWSGGVALRRLPLWGKRRLGGGASFPNGGRRLHFRWSSLGREGGGEALPTPLNLGHRRTPASPPPPPKSCDGPPPPPPQSVVAQRRPPPPRAVWVQGRAAAGTPPLPPVLPLSLQAVAGARRRRLWRRRGWPPLRHAVASRLPPPPPRPPRFSPLSPRPPPSGAPARAATRSAAGVAVGRLHVRGGRVGGTPAPGALWGLPLPFYQLPLPRRVVRPGARHA